MPSSSQFSESSYAPKIPKQHKTTLKTPDEINFENCFIWIYVIHISIIPGAQNPKPSKSRALVVWPKELVFNQLASPTILKDWQGIRPMLSSYSSHGSPFKPTKIRCVVFLPNSYRNGPNGEIGTHGKILEKPGICKWFLPPTVCLDSCVLYETHLMLYPHKFPTCLSTLVSPNVSASVPSLGLGS